MNLLLHISDFQDDHRSWSFVVPGAPDDNIAAVAVGERLAKEGHLVQVGPRLHPLRQVKG